PTFKTAVLTINDKSQLLLSARNCRLCFERHLSVSEHEADIAMLIYGGEVRCLMFFKEMLIHESSV
ncbi:hypothetical protein DL968_16790, partial [Escherichia coli]|nr:hypothetical protein [Escherichia coli]